MLRLFCGMKRRNQLEPSREVFMYQIGFIGCGNMGSAMVQGILAHGLFDPEQVVVTHLTGKGAAGSRDRRGDRGRRKR